ncbi:MAG: DUF445 domain-containing protein [Gammaproteobacteria bacterium]|nr:DUF445 domain-containing protein [Gammaproteobacteria bacterium]
MNKSATTNVTALAVAIAGYFSPVFAQIIMMTGIFALSGGVTNWLAVHMLFERIPFIYGSGVIPARFNEFKAAIRLLILTEFFSQENVERFLDEAGMASGKLGENIDLDRAFDGFAEVIEQSSMGNMLAMMGGRKALEPLRTPVKNKFGELITEFLAGADTSAADANAGETGAQALRTRIEGIVDNRLAELTPEQVQTIVEDMIRQHLGWLVVWGGVFGGAIGLAVSLLQAA